MNEDACAFLLLEFVVPLKPVGVVERRIGEDGIGVEVGMLIRVKTGSAALTEIGVNAANAEIHQRQLAGSGRVGEVFQEDQAKADSLVIRSVNMAAHLVGGRPELCFNV